VAKFHGNILNLSENIAKSLGGGLTQEYFITVFVSLNSPPNKIRMVIDF